MIYLCILSEEFLMIEPELGELLLELFVLVPDKLKFLFKAAVFLQNMLIVFVHEISNC